MVPAADTAEAGTAAVTVVNPGVGTASNAVPLTVREPSSGVFYANSASDPVPVVPQEVGDFLGGGGSQALAMVVSASGGPAELRVYSSDASGVFAAGPATPLPPGAGVLGVGDFNGGGKQDVLTADQNGVVTVLFGNGDGTFTPGPGVQTGGSPFVFAVDIGDFNHDGKLDFVGQEGIGGPIQVFFGNGDGTFTPGPVTELPAAVVGGGRFHLIDGGMGDLNRDGNLDLVVTDGYYLEMMLGRGDGTFSPGPGQPLNLGAVGDSVAVADFNGDGVPDIAVPNGGAADRPPLEVLLGNGDGTFSLLPGCCGDPEALMHGIDARAGDLNGDGKMDVALTVQDLQSTTPANYMEVFLGRGDGTFTPSNFSEILPALPNALWIADVEGDGGLDFLMREFQYGNLWAMLQGPPPATAPDFTLTPASAAVTVAAGKAVMFQVEIASVGGFLGALSPMACSGAPPLGTCQVTEQPPGMLIPTARGSFPVEVTTQGPIVVGAASDGLASRPAMAGLMALCGVAMLVLATGAVRRRQGDAGPAGRRRRGAVMGAGALLGGVVLLFACGGSPPLRAGVIHAGTPPGTYTVTVSVSAAGTTRTASIRVTVQ